MSLLDMKPKKAYLKLIPLKEYALEQISAKGRDNGAFQSNGGQKKDINKNQEKSQLDALVYNFKDDNNKFDFYSKLEKELTA